jgi:hypothetical protein
LVALPSAQAVIVYTNPADLTATDSTGVFFNLDLNGTGAATGTANFSGADFRIYRSSGSLYIRSYNGAFSGNSTYARKLTAGASVNSLGFASQSLGYLRTSSGWNDGDTGYLGFRFTSSGNTYYGWAQISYVAGTSLTLLDFAYENSPSTLLLAGAGAIPEPAETAIGAGIAALLAGSAALHRRRQQRRLALAAAPASV